MEQISTFSLFLLFVRVQLFLFGIIFSAIATIAKSQFHTHGKISRIDSRCKLHKINAAKIGTSETD